MKKFITLLFALCITLPVWAAGSAGIANPTQAVVKPQLDQAAKADPVSGPTTAASVELADIEARIVALKEQGLPVPADLYKAARELHGLPVHEAPADRQGGDTVAEATLVDSLPYNDTGTTVGYTDDYDEVCPYEGSTSPDVCYYYEPTSDITVYITLCNGSDYDTKLYVYENEVTPGNYYACNDDACPGYVSELFGLELTGGNTYYIIIDGYYGDAGNYILDITQIDDCIVECPPEGIPENEEDCYDEYVDVTNGGCNSDGYPFGVIGIDEYICGTSGTYMFEGNNYRDTDWFIFTIEETSTVYAEAEAEFPLQIFFVDHGDCSSPAVIVGNNATNPCTPISIETILMPGEYTFWVGPSVFSDWDCGLPFVGFLTAEPFETEEGDSCDDPLYVDALPYQFFGTTVDNVDTYGNPAPDEWHQFDIAVESLVYMTLCGGGTDYDSYVYLMDDACTTELASNDDACAEQPLVSEIITILQPGTYVFGVDGFSSNSGAYQLDIWAEPFETDEGDTCSDPFIADALPYTYTGTTADNMDTYGNGSPDEWHQFTVTARALVIMELCDAVTDYDTYMYLLADDCVTQLAYNDDGPECPESGAPYPPSEIVMELDPGTYVVAVDGYSASEMGNYVLEIYEGEPYVYLPCQEVHGPDDPWSAGTSHTNGDDIDYLRADRFGQAGEVTGVELWGLSLVYDDGWFECSEDPMGFDIYFYEDGAMPGAELASFWAEVSPDPTGDAYAGYPLYLFYLPLEDRYYIEEGWIAVQTSGECWFLWMSAYGTDEMSALSTLGAPWEVYGYDLAYCLSFDDVAETTTPQRVMLHPNYPNPFNPVTTITYDLALPAEVDLLVYNITGETVSTLVDGPQSAGTHSLQFDGSDLPSGIYFYRLTVDDFSKTQRMLLVK